MDKLKYWLTTNVTTGQPYHTLEHCMREDKIWVMTLILLLAFIVIQYFDIAYVSWKKGKSYEDSPLKKGFIQLTLVFSFCAISGYGFRIIQFAFPAYKLLIFLLIVLNIWTNKLRLTLRNSDFLARLYAMKKREEEHEATLKVISEIINNSNLSKSEILVLSGRIKNALNRHIDKI